VLNDITRLRRLEKVRRDFVANVSHELKTPITSIRGAVETMGEGALESPESAERFLEMIARQADRLNVIIEDLLMLSRLEGEEEGREIELEKASIAPVLRAAMRSCESKAAYKSVTLEATCDEDIAARIDAALLEIAVVNLMDNAIKYSESGSKVLVSCEMSGGEIDIRVRDEGSGIAAKHLPRLFERFYRVDKARSRKLGGTGLGLAIVKHIAQVHGGSVSVESTPGEGSTFTIHLPLA
jgi:two-component system phosphate regulon sensor histidine kinase PhoR